MQPRNEQQQETTTRTKGRGSVTEPRDLDTQRKLDHGKSSPLGAGGSEGMQPLPERLHNAKRGEEINTLDFTFSSLILISSI